MSRNQESGDRKCFMIRKPSSQRSHTRIMHKYYSTIFPSSHLKGKNHEESVCVHGYLGVAENSRESSTFLMQRYKRADE